MRPHCAIGARLESAVKPRFCKLCHFRLSATDIRAGRRYCRGHEPEAKDRPRYGTAEELIREPEKRTDRQGERC